MIKLIVKICESGHNRHLAVFAVFALQYNKLNILNFDFTQKGAEALQNLWFCKIN